MSLSPGYFLCYACGELCNLPDCEFICVEEVYDHQAVKQTKAVHPNCKSGLFYDEQERVYYKE